MRNYYIFIAILGVFVLILISLSFYLTGSPASQQARTLDSTRMAHFDSIKYEIENYFREHGGLPTQLSELRSIKNFITDPQTKNFYDYEQVSKISYKLCTEFSTDSEENSDTYTRYSPNIDLTHSKGYDCIEYTIPNYVMPEPTIPQAIPTITSR